MSKCRSCDAEIIWRKSPKGKNMPMDPEPVPEGEGKWILDRDRAIYAPEDGTYQCHFETCPNADEHRSRNSGATVECPKCRHRFVRKAR